jgi:hypothetical protein
MAPNPACPGRSTPISLRRCCRTGDNIRDNVEQVLIANPVPGKDTP